MKNNKHNIEKQTKKRKIKKRKKNLFNEWRLLWIENLMTRYKYPEITIKFLFILKNPQIYKNYNESTNKYF